jgi:hypothetical protein
VATELRPGVLEMVFSKVAAESGRRSRAALEPVANAIVKQARINAGNGRHARGTPTPAHPGNGPAMISGTLRASLDRSIVKRIPTGWECLIGTAVGRRAPYSKTNASLVGWYLEAKGLRNGAKFPFLRPAGLFVGTIAAPQIYKAMYGEAWARFA